MRNLYFQPRLCRHLHLDNRLRSHTGCRHPPQLTLEAGTTHPPNTVTQMRAVPSFSPRQAMRKFGKLSVFSEIENNFRILDRCISKVSSYQNNLTTPIFDSSIFYQTYILDYNDNNEYESNHLCKGKHQHPRLRETT